MRRHIVVVVVVVLAMSCTAQTSPSASPLDASAAVTATPAPTAARPAVSPSASLQPRISVSDGPLTSSAGTYVFFQLPSDPRLRAISFDARSSGVVPLQVAQGAVWSQSTGTPFVIGTTAYTREGVTLGTVPWPAGRFTWSREGRLMCELDTPNDRTGEVLRLQTAAVGQAPKVIANGLGTYSDNATHTVLACDEGRDRVIAALFGQGVAPSKLWIIRLSNGTVVRSVDYRDRATRWVAASADGSLIAESEQVGTAPQWRATIRSADDDAVLGTVDGIVQGFSGDNTLAVVSSVNSAAVVEWKTGRTVWSAADTYGGFLAEPAGKRIAVGVGFTGGSDKADVYLVQPDGTASLLPARLRVMLRY